MISSELQQQLSGFVVRVLENKLTSTQPMTRSEVTPTTRTTASASPVVRLLHNKERQRGIRRSRGGEGLKYTLTASSSLLS